jgi:hypothetical protein
MNLHGGVRHAVTEGELYLPQGPPSVTLRIGNLGLSALQPVQRLDDVFGLLLDQLLGVVDAAIVEGAADLLADEVQQHFGGKLAQLLIQFAGVGWVVVQPYEQTYMQASSGG